MYVHTWLEFRILWLKRTIRDFDNIRWISDTIGGFPMEIKTEISSYAVLLILPYEIMMTTNCMISYFSFDFDRKSTYCYCVKTLLSKIKQHYARINLSEISTFFKIYCIQQM